MSVSYFKFYKSKLNNLSYSLSREFLLSNNRGCFMSTTISGCNTRKYHGLFICPFQEAEDGKHVLLSSLDETVIQHGAAFNLGIHKYKGDFYNPKGHKYIIDFDWDVVPKTTFRAGGAVISKEIILSKDKMQTMIRYTLKDSHSSTILKFSPFLSFRSIHSLSKANLYANTKYKKISNGIEMRLYDGYPNLCMQFSKDAEFVPVPDWYYNVEYSKEKERGYEDMEDLLVPGYFEIPMKNGESVVFSASTKEIVPEELNDDFNKEYNSLIKKDSLINCLRSAADQFFIKLNDGKDMVAGFPWYNGILRQTFVALPGLTLALGDKKTFEEILDTQLQKLKDGLFPKFSGNCKDYDSMDAPLWFFWDLQQFYKVKKNSKYIWKKYGYAMKHILENFKNGTLYGIGMNDDGLITSNEKHRALTWMDACINGEIVIKRNEKPVEVNALWYNAVCFALRLAKLNVDKTFVKEWESMPSLIADSFINEFWNDEKGYLCDCVSSSEKDWSVRPNMVIAAAMDYSPLNRDMKKSILSIAKKQLLTPSGLRSLSPSDLLYKGFCSGSVDTRKKEVFQGTSWPWLIQFFVEEYINIYNEDKCVYLKEIIEYFGNRMSDYCLGTISEMYNGNPPYNQEGAISQAWSIGSLIRTYKIIKDFDNIKNGK